MVFKRKFAVLVLVLLAALLTDVAKAQNALGKHPSDKILDNLFDGTNGVANANAIMRGLNLKATLDATFVPEGGLSTNDMLGVMRQQEVVTNQHGADVTLNAELKFGGDVEQVGLIVKTLTTAQRNAINESVIQGAIIWNSTTERFEVAIANDNWRQMAYYEDLAALATTAQLNTASNDLRTVIDNSTNNASIVRTAALAAGSVPVAGSAVTGNIPGRAGTVNSIGTNFVEFVSMLNTNMVTDLPLPIWNVRLPPFNALGGTNNDRAAIQLALDYAYTNGGTVFLPFSCYAWRETSDSNPHSANPPFIPGTPNEPCILAMRGTNIAMAGANLSVRLGIPTNAPPSTHFIQVWGNNITIQNLTLEGNAQRLGTNRLDAFNPQYGTNSGSPMPDEDAITPQYYWDKLVMENLVIQNWANEGIDMDWYVTPYFIPRYNSTFVRHITFTNTYGASLEGAQGTIVERCVFKKGGWVGDQFNGAVCALKVAPYMTTVSDCWFENSPNHIDQENGAPFNTNITYGIVVERCQFFSPETNSIRLSVNETKSHPVTIRDNVFHVTNITTGVSVWTVQPGALIENNRFFYNQTNSGGNIAIRTAGRYSIIRDNIVTNAYINPIEAFQTLENNRIWNPGLCVYVNFANASNHTYLNNKLHVQATSGVIAPITQENNCPNQRYENNFFFMSLSSGGRLIDMSTNCVAIGNEFRGQANQAIQFRGTNNLVTGNQNFSINNYDGTVRDTSANPASQRLHGNNWGEQIYSVPVGDTVVYGMQTKTTNYTTTAYDTCLSFNGSNLTNTLLSASVTGVKGRPFIVKNIHATALEITNATGAQTFDGALRLSLAQYEKRTLVSDGANWLIVGD